MSRVKLTIEYDGTAYAGWQLQANGPSVQARIEEALLQLTGSAVRVHSASRTDAGVHARGMVIHFDVERSLPLSAYREGMNRYLPQDVAVCAAEYVAEDFHSRFCNSGKWYRYTLCQAPVRSPLFARTSWHVSRVLDLEVMRRAAACFEGCYDFSAFRSSRCSAKTTVKELTVVTVIDDTPLIYIDVEGSGFLQNMVRIMAGTLVEIGLHKRSPDSIAELLQNGRRADAGRTAPAHGLCLMRINYAPGYNRRGTVLYGGREKVNKNNKKA
ncbi:MAG: tRNA pseudouridine(38-40) synthase TruA [Desulfuromonas sp.]|nr:MAG: tRNA pseudouridine(38-40) synthase TruA [Desulfuromonas sp.]